MNQMTTQGQPTAAVAPARSAGTGRIKFDLMDPAAFAHIQRVAAIYAASPLFPEHLRKGSSQEAIANAILCMNIAERLNEDAITVGQNIYFVGGKPGWNATYMIAKANMHGAFDGPIEWASKGSGETLSVTATATLAKSGKKVSKTITFQNAKEDGWTRNAKYKSMPETMLQYRTATALIRLYCPEVMIGMPVGVEVEDEQHQMRDITPFEAAAEVQPEQPTDRLIEPGHEETATPRKVDRTPPAPAEKPKAEDPETIDPETGEVLQSDEQPTEAALNNAPDPESFKGLQHMILQDLADAPNIDDVLDLYAPQIQQMEAAAPDLHAELQKHILAYQEQGKAEA